MRKILSVLAVLVLVVFAACEKEKVVEAPGEIPGMGETPGELSVEAFNLPEGIELVGSMTGIEEGSTSAMVKDDLSLKSTFDNESVQTFGNYGSGGQFVKIRCKLRNTTNQRRTCFFPRGLVCKVDNEEHQHGILLQWAWICLEPNQIREFVMHFYCVNRGRLGSNIYTNYHFHGVTTSNVIWGLLNLISWRTINFEHYYGGSTSYYNLKEGGLSYEEITEGLQDAVWAITNGDGLNDDQKQFIESIPMLEEGSYPEGLEDGTIDPYGYYPEYTITD